MRDTDSLPGASAKGETYPLRKIKDLTKITSLYPRNAPKSGQIHYYDEEIAGLSVRPLKFIDKKILEKGRRYRFYFDCRDSGGPCRVSLGKNISTYELASHAVKEIQLKLFRDPSLDLVTERKTARAVERGENTFEHMSDRYLKERAKFHRDGGKEAMKTVKRLCKVFGKRDAASIDRVEFSTWLEGHVADGKKPTGLRSLMKVIYDFGVEKRIVNVANPATGFKLNGVAAAVNYRALDDDEIKIVLEKLSGRREEFADLFRVLLLTGQRPKMWYQAKWSEITWAKDDDIKLNRTKLTTLTIPWERCKTARIDKPHSHTIPVVGDALRIIKKRFDSEDRDAEFIFPSFKTKDSAQTIIKREMRNLRRETEFAEDWHFYGLRSTFATGAKDLGLDTETRQMVMDHSIGKVEAAYISKRLKLMAELLKVWDKHIDEIVNGKPKADVINMADHRGAVEA